MCCGRVCRCRRVASGWVRRWRKGVLGKRGSRMVFLVGEGNYEMVRLRLLLLLLLYKKGLRAG